MSAESAPILTPMVRESITVRAPLERCFALATEVELVKKTLGMEPAADGVTTGRVTKGSRVVWRGWKFGLPTEHHTLISAYEPPHPVAGGAREALFQDMQERGRFTSFHHDHFFREEAGVTTMRDAVYFTLPFGVLGRAVARLVMRPYVRRLTRQRFAMLKTLAEQATEARVAA